MPRCRRVRRGTGNRAGRRRHGGAGRSDRAGTASLADAGRQPLERNGARRRWPVSPNVSQLPVATCYRRGPLFDPLHPNYAGDLGLARQSETGGAGQGQRSGDRGGRPAERDHHAGLHPVRNSHAADPLVHVYPGAEELGRVYRPHLAIHASPSVSPPRWTRWCRVAPAPWAAQARAAHEDYLAWSETPVPQPGAVNLSAIMIWLRENLPADAITLQRRGQLCRLDSSLLPLPPLRHPDRADLRDPWAMACPPPWR